MSISLHAEGRPIAQAFEQADNLRYIKTGWTINTGGFTTVMSSIAGFKDATFPTGATTVYVYGGATDILGGAGAEKIELTYLDTDYNLQTATADLNGTTVVQVATDFFRYISLRVTQSNNGANDGFNEGPLIISDVGKTLVYGGIFLQENTGGGNLDTTLVFTVPAGWNCLIEEPWHSMTTTAGSAKQRLYIREEGGVWQLRGESYITGVSFVAQIPAIWVPEKTDIDVKGMSETGAFGFSGLSLLLLPNAA